MDFSLHLCIILLAMFLFSIAIDEVQTTGKNIILSFLRASPIADHYTDSFLRIRQLENPPSTLSGYLQVNTGHHMTMLRNPRLSPCEH